MQIPINSNIENYSRQKSLTVFVIQWKYLWFNMHFWCLISSLCDSRVWSISKYTWIIDRTYKYYPGMWQVELKENASHSDNPNKDEREDEITRTKKSSWQQLSQMQCFKVTLMNSEMNCITIFRWTLTIVQNLCLCN